MPTGLSGYHGGKRLRTKKLDQYTSKHYKAIVDYLEITDEYLITISTITETSTPLLEFTFQLGGGWGVEKFVCKLLKEMENKLVKEDPYKREYAELFSIPYKEVSEEQRLFMKDYFSQIKNYNIL